MRSNSLCLGLTIALACSGYLSGLASAQAVPIQDDRTSSMDRTFGTGNLTLPANTPQPDSPQPERIRLRNNRGSYPAPQNHSPSVPFSGRYRVDCGDQILVTENANGIFVYVNGRSVRANNAAELRQRYPDAFRLYDVTVGNQKRIAIQRFAEMNHKYSDVDPLFSPSVGLPNGQLKASASQDRSISVMENGKKVSITGNKNGITVSVNGKRVRANNVAQLKKKFPDAFRTYEKQLAAANGFGEDFEPLANKQ